MVSNKIYFCLSILSRRIFNFALQLAVRKSSEKLKKEFKPNEAFISMIVVCIPTVLIELIFQIKFVLRVVLN